MRAAIFSPSSFSKRAPLTTAAAEAAFADAKGYGDNDFKIALGKRTLRRALMQAAALEI